MLKLNVEHCTLTLNVRNIKSLSQSENDNTILKIKRVTTNTNKNALMSRRRKSHTI